MRFIASVVLSFLFVAAAAAGEPRSSRRTLADIEAELQSLEKAMVEQVRTCRWLAHEYKFTKQQIVDNPLPFPFTLAKKYGALAETGAQPHDAYAGLAERYKRSAQKEAEVIRFYSSQTELILADVAKLGELLTASRAEYDRLIEEAVNHPQMRLRRGSDVKRSDSNETSQELEALMRELEQQQSLPLEFGVCIVREEPKS